jgi:hypothetical protein
MNRRAGHAAERAAQMKRRRSDFIRNGRERQRSGEPFIDGPARRLDQLVITAIDRRALDSAMGFGHDGGEQPQTAFVHQHGVGCDGAAHVFENLPLPQERACRDSRAATVAEVRNVWTASHLSNDNDVALVQHSLARWQWSAEDRAHVDRQEQKACSAEPREKRAIDKITGPGLSAGATAQFHFRTIPRHRSAPGRSTFLITPSQRL